MEERGGTWVGGPCGERLKGWSVYGVSVEQRESRWTTKICGRGLESS